MNRVDVIHPSDKVSAVNAVNKVHILKRTMKEAETRAEHIDPALSRIEGGGFEVMLCTEAGK